MIEIFWEASGEKCVRETSSALGDERCRMTLFMAPVLPKLGLTHSALLPQPCFPQFFSWLFPIQMFTFSVNY
jgi:hypothetical protein